MYRLYKKDSKGKLRFLFIEASADEMIQYSGLDGGKTVINKSKCVGKNIGKANETTSFEQARLEAEAKFKKKLKEGYFESKEEALSKVVMLPMLAKSFGKEEKKVKYPCFAQPKLDGMRGLGKCDKVGSLTSRSGNQINNLLHIVEKMPYMPGLILDGELYAHGETFQENMRMIKKYRPGKTEKITYHVYDIVSEMPFEKRYQTLRDICLKLAPTPITLVPTKEIKNKEELMKFHAYNISRGYEGTMVRWGDEGYKLNGRSSNLLKLKEFHDLALPLKDVIPSEKRPTHGKPIFEWKGANNDELGAGISLSHAEAEDLLANKSSHIGKICELRFFEYSDTGVPRHPVMYGFRLDK